MTYIIYCDAIAALTRAAEHQNDRVLAQQKLARGIQRRKKQSKAAAFASAQKMTKTYDTIVDELMELLSTKKEAEEAVTDSAIITVLADTYVDAIYTQRIHATSMADAYQKVEDLHASNGDMVDCSIEVVVPSNAFRPLVAYAYADTDAEQ